MTILGILLLCSQTSAIIIPNLPQEAYTKLGDFNLGVLIPVHKRNIHDFCGSEVLHIGQLQRVEAVAKVVQLINEDNRLLRNHTLGFVIFDDCHSDQTALVQALHFSRSTLPEECIDDDYYDADVSTSPENLCSGFIEQYDVFGVIGSENSITTIQAANLLTSLGLPQLSYFSTAPVLSNQGRYSLFQRIVPSDNVQAQVLLQLMATFNWTFIYVVYAEGAYGEGLYRAMERTLQDDANDRSTCFVEPFVISQDFDDEDYTLIVTTMFHEQIANVCLIIAQDFEAFSLFRAVMRVPGSERHPMTWIASDAWARNIHSLKPVLPALHGMLSLNIYATNIHSFDRYFQSISTSHPTENPWLQKYWKQFFNCTLHNETGGCPQGLHIADHPSYNPDNTVSLVFDAVSVFARALDSQINTKCKFMTGTQLKYCVKEGFGEAVRNVSFRGAAHTVVQFDENGDGMTSYHIQNIQYDNSSSLGYRFRLVGRWDRDAQTLNIDTKSIEWPSGRKPMSNCSYPCAIGEAMEVHQKRCCWSCVPCAEYQYTAVKHGIIGCHTCPENTWPHQETRDHCVEMEKVFISANSGIGAVLVSLATVGIGMSAAVFVLFLVNNKNQLIKASSRELSYFMLGGITLSFVAIFPLVATPTQATCFLSEAGLIVAFSMVYTPLAIKTIRIWRIFEAGRLMTKKPKCISCSSQILLTLLMIIAQTITICAWSSAEPPYPETVARGNNLEVFCTFPLLPFVTCMGINILLLLISAIFAIKARNLPDNFNECRFISFCALSTTLLWLAFLSSYFTTRSRYKAVFVALMVFSNGCIMHGGLFLPKLYAVYFVQKKGIEPENSCVSKSN